MREFGNIFGNTQSLLLGAPHLSEKLWAEAIKAAVYIRKRTPTGVLGGKAPLEAWESKPLSRQQSISPGSASAQHWSLITNIDKIAHASYEQAEYEPITEEDNGSIGAGKPGEIGYMPPDGIYYMWAGG